MVFTAGEERGQLGASQVVEQVPFGPLQAVVIPEPSHNDVYIAERGCLWLEITVSGKAAHGSTPQLGCNAIAHMLELLRRWDQAPASFTPHPLLGGFTRSTDTITGGVATNVVPDSCTVTIDQRTVPGQDHRAILSQLNSVVTELRGERANFDAAVRVIHELPPIDGSPEHPAVRQFCAAVASVTSASPVPRGAPYYTDGAILAPALNAPLIICGPGDPGLAHQANEFVEVDRMVVSAQVLAAAAARMLAA